MLKRLAYISYANQKYSDAEKYFTVVVNLMPNVTKNPSNIFQSKKNLLIFYTHTNLDKAMDLAQMMKKDSDNSEFLPSQQRDLDLMTADLHLLMGEYQIAKNMYRNQLQINQSNLTKAHVLNNLAYASWQHYVQFTKEKKHIV